MEKRAACGCRQTCREGVETVQAGGWKTAGQQGHELVLARQFGGPRYHDSGRSWEFTGLQV